MFATGSLARRIERAEASLIEAGALNAAGRTPQGQAFATPLREGMAAFAEAGSFRAFEGVAQLCGSATLPEHRRRDVQTALLRHRLAEASRRGCDVAVVTTQPGSKSQENVERFGFTLLYVRAILTMDRRAAAGGR